MSNFIILNSWKSSERIPCTSKVSSASPYELSCAVSKYLDIQRVDNNAHEKLVFDRIVVIKDPDGKADALLKDLIVKIGSDEKVKRVNFGVFTKNEDKIRKLFKILAKKHLRDIAEEDRSGRIFSIELNGTGKGSGVVSGEDKLYSWTDL